MQFHIYALLIQPYIFWKMNKKGILRYLCFGNGVKKEKNGKYNWLD